MTAEEPTIQYGKAVPQPVIDPEEAKALALKAAAAMTSDPRIETAIEHAKTWQRYDGWTIGQMAQGVLALAARLEAAERDLADARAELEREQALFRAVCPGDRPPLSEAAQTTARHLAEHVAAYLPLFHRGHELTKPEAMTLQGIREMADDFAALAAAQQPPAEEPDG